MPFGMKPHAHSFPGRNRIIAGMTRAIAVIEASLKSGSLITATDALDYGREVFAVPGSPMDPRCAGTNSLIKQGATMLESARDITAALVPMGTLPLAETEHQGFAEPPPPPSEDMMRDARAELLQALSPTPSLLEEVLQATGLTPHLMMAVLLEFELAGRLQRHPGAKVSLRIDSEKESA
jgi:DNA processing protein